MWAKEPNLNQKNGYEFIRRDTASPKQTWLIFNSNIIETYNTVNIMSKLVHVSIALF